MADDEILIDDAELERELELSSEEIERGECVDGDEVVAKLRHFRA